MVKSSNIKPNQMQVIGQEKKPIGRLLFSLIQAKSKGKVKAELLSKKKEWLQET